VVNYLVGIAEETGIDEADARTNRHQVQRFPAENVDRDRRGETAGVRHLSRQCHGICKVIYLVIESLVNTICQDCILLKQLTGEDMS